MRNIVEIECPPELLIDLHTSAEQFGARVKREATYNLFRHGGLRLAVASGPTNIAPN